MAIYTYSIADSINPQQSVSVTNGKTIPFYGSVQDADNYFTFRLHCDEWFDADLRTKISALAQATRQIDRLNFVGSRASTTQLLEFPRAGQLSVPIVIEQATYELALLMLNGVVPDTEAANLSTVTRGYGPMKTEYLRTFAVHNVKAGIPSFTAWNLLYPYLRSIEGVKLSRVS